MSSYLDLSRQYTTIVADTDDFESIREHTPQDDANNVNPSDKRMKTLVSSTKGSSGKLNPNWVEQLMGLPPGWTQLPTHWSTG